MKHIIKFTCLLLIITILSIRETKAQTFDTYTGAGAGASNIGTTTGSYNSGFGSSSLNAVTNGNNNTAAGYLSLGVNTASNNSAFGYEALQANTTGTPNDAFGYQAGYSNTTGTNNVAVGYQSLYSNTAGELNTAIGYQALYSNNGTSSTGNSNVALGYKALYSNSTAIGNVAIGADALYYASNQGYNVAVGTSALFNNTNENNDALGRKALYNNTTGTPNDAFGYEALLSNVSGNNNDAFGYLALYYSTGNDNCGFGVSSLYNTTGGDNTAIGYQAGINNTTGSDNTYVGSTAGSTAGSGLSNYTAIGYNAGNSGTPQSNWIDLGNTSVTEIRAEVTSITSLSDARIKDNVQDNVPGLAFITRLRPVTYNLNIHHQHEITSGGRPDTTNWPGKYDIEKRTQTGFIAQEVEKAAKASNYDFSGLHRPSGAKDLYGLKYSEFVVPLVKAVQEQQQIIEQQAGSIKALNVTVTQQQDALNNVLAKMEVMSAQLQDIKDCCSNNGSSSSTASSNLTIAQLFNAVPNPTSNSSAIYYFVPATAKSANIQLTYGNGTVMKTIPVSTSGYSSVVINTDTLASGIYLYSLIVDDQLIDTKKLSVVLK